MNAQVPDRMPGAVKLALVGVWFQAVINGLGGWWLLSLINTRLDHGQDVSHLGLVRASAYFSFAVAAVLALSALYAPKRFGWVRSTLVAVEGLAILGALFGLFSGTGPSALIGMALAIWIGSVMLGERGRNWFHRQADAHDERTADYGT
ncbi:hypothetical protein ACFY7Z_06640 [Streptomyces sp. NPDC012623]|uniref:hypothetical protein n=1 Tax=unclassified Streptomyces TaxID=2593676 RepID=UPI0036AE1E48